MKLAKRGPCPAVRVHPLLFGACTCGLPAVLCLACARWRRHYRMVTQRRAAWEGRHG